MKQHRLSFFSLQFLILEIKKPAGANSGEQDGWDDAGIPVSPRTPRQRPKNGSLHYRAENTRTQFPETQA
jgi:hypothetical protein